MKHDATERRTRRGYLIMAGLVLAAVLVFNLDVIADRFRGYVDVVVLVEETNGVRVGSRVLVEGIEAGRVTGIAFADGGDGTSAIAMGVRLRERATAVVRKGSRAYTARRRFIGEPTVRIDAGPGGAPPVESGDTLRPARRPSLESLLEKGKQFPGALDSLNSTLVRLQELVEGRRPQLDTMLDRLAVLTDEAVILRDDVQQGTLARWFDDPDIARRVRRIREHAASLQQAVDRLRLTDPDAELRQQIDALSRRARQLDARLAALQQSLEEGEGMVPRLRQDSALVVAVRGVQAQIDSLRAEGLDLALRMFLP